MPPPVILLITGILLADSKLCICFPVGDLVLADYNRLVVDSQNEEIISPVLKKILINSQVEIRISRFKVDAEHSLGFILCELLKSIYHGVALSFTE